MRLSVCVFACAIPLSACAGRGEGPTLDRLHPCRASEGPTDGWCGTVDVREDRHAENGRHIALNVVVLPALKQRHAPDPLFVLTGGPGQAATASAEDARDLFRPIATHRDIVLIDQRGTGKSNPLECAATANAAVDRLHACLDSYRDVADVTKYTTEIAMEDLDEVRSVLHYQRINLYGVSYGTRAALIYARRHPDRTRAVIPDSAAPRPMRVPLYIARDSQRAMDLLIRDSNQDVACRKRFPNLRERLDALLARLDAHPEHLDYADPTTGIHREMAIHGGVHNWPRGGSTPDKSLFLALVMTRHRWGA